MELIRIEPSDAAEGFAVTGFAKFRRTDLTEASSPGKAIELQAAK